VIQCQNPVAKKIKLTQYCTGIGASFIIRLDLGEVQTLKSMHKYFQDFLAPCCVTWHRHLFGWFWGFDPDQKIPIRNTLSLTLHSLALTRPQMPKDTSHRQPSRLFWGNRPPEGSTHQRTQICLQPLGQRRCALLPVAYTDQAWAKMSEKYPKIQ
jgi:hypothetical protein